MSNYKDVNGMRFRLGSLVYDKTVAIYNTGGAAADCPSDHAGYCIHSEICYARKSEFLYRNVIKYRRKQGRTWRHTDAKTFANALTQLHAMGVKYLRFNESSDFFSQQDVDKLNEAASLTPVTIFGYTANPFLSYEGSLINLKLSQYYNVKGTTGRAIAIPKGSDVPRGFKLCPKTSGKIKKCTERCSVCFTKAQIDVAFFQH